MRKKTGTVMKAREHGSGAQETALDDEWNAAREHGMRITQIRGHQSASAARAAQTQHLRNDHPQPTMKHHDDAWRPPTSDLQ